ncbi:MAG: PLP-dependent aminotransferase family protein [Candidatus Cloacimonetes bacterium]|nr:PLP-dependent aminotransferase family protein [Candidatus Cloacimonadota bacterium]
MVSDLQSIYSANAKGMQRSAIRELLKLTAQPDIISFAGGLPAPESFPIDDLREVITEVMTNEPTRALQYGPTEGDSLLQEELIKHYNREGMNLKKENILITTSSQQGLDLVAKIFFDRGDKAIVGLPTYLGGLGAFNSYGADLVGVELDEHGMRPDHLEEELKRLHAKGEKPKFIYIIPDFQNPAGITMPRERRLEIIDIAKRYNQLIIEDSPYRELRFEGEPVPWLNALDNEGNVLTLGTFSKIFLPGFRLGWAIGHASLIDKLVVAKQSVDLCAPPFNQRVAGRFLQKGYLEKNIAKIIGMYREKRDIMLAGFREHMPEEVTWTEPEGGLFLFLTAPEYIDMGELFPKALEKKVAFVLGSAFYCNGGGKNTARINFSFSTIEQIVEGVKRLASVLKEAIANHK